MGDNTREKIKVPDCLVLYLPTLIWLALFYALLPMYGTLYHADAYANALLGDSLVRNGLYWSPAIRENFVGETHYARTFPPLIPIFYGSINFLLHTGVSSGFILNLVVSYFTLYLLLIAGNRLLPGKGYVFCILYALLLANFNRFTFDYLHGGSIPFSFSLFVLLFLLSESQPAPAGYLNSLLSGCVLALMYLARFDTTLFCLSFPMLQCLRGRLSYSHTALLYFSFFLFVSPWSISNYLRFGSPFSSNQTQLIFSVFDDNPIIGFLKNGIPLMYDHPLLWVALRISGFFQSLLIIGSGVSRAVGSVGAGVLIYFSYYLITLRNKIQPSVGMFLEMGILWCLLNIFICTVTMNLDQRYFSISVLIVLMIGAIGFYKFIMRKSECMYEEASRIRRYFIPFSLGLVLVVSIISINIKALSHDESEAVTRSVTKAIAPYVDKSNLLGAKLGGNTELLAEMVSYYTGWRTIYIPPNIPKYNEDFVAWQKAFHVMQLLVRRNSEFAADHHFTKIMDFGDYVLLSAPQT